MGMEGGGISGDEYSTMRWNIGTVYLGSLDRDTSHRCQHGLRKMRESARIDISRTHANFASAHKCEQNTTYSYTL